MLVCWRWFCRWRLDIVSHGSQLWFVGSSPVFLIGGFYVFVERTHLVKVQIKVAVNRIDSIAFFSGEFNVEFQCSILASRCHNFLKGGSVCNWGAIGGDWVCSS